MDGRYTFYRTLIIASTLLFLLLLWRLAETIIVLLGAIIFASAIRPLVQRLTRLHIPMGPAILLIYLTLFGLVTALLAFALPPLYNQANELLSEEGLVQRLATAVYNQAVALGYGEQVATPLARAPRLWDEWTAQLNSQLAALAEEQGLEIAQEVATGIGQVILALVMAFYWLTARERIQGLLLSITPIRHRGQLEDIINDVERTLGDYVRGTVILMLSIGLSALVGLLLLRVPFALPLALLAGLFEAVPMVGATLGALPAVFVAFTVSPTMGLLTVLLFALIQFLENNVLVPRVMEKSVGLNPLLVIIAIVAGGSLNGIVGALLAIPLAGALQVIVRYLVVEPMKEEANQRHDEGGVPIFDIPYEESEAANNKKPSDIIIAQP